MCTKMSGQLEAAIIQLQYKFDRKCDIWLRPRLKSNRQTSLLFQEFFIQLDFRKPTKLSHKAYVYHFITPIMYIHSSDTHALQVFGDIQIYLSVLVTICHNMAVYLYIVPIVLFMHILIFHTSTSYVISLCNEISYYNY